MHTHDDDDSTASEAPIPEVVPPPSTYAPVYWYTQSLMSQVQALRVRDKRSIFVAMREKADVSPESFLPRHGLCVAEFAVFQTLGDKPRRST